jgi:zinc/manganese transport system permease protein
MSPQFTINVGADLSELFQFPFMVNALEAGTIVAVMAAIVGWFVVLRRETFVAHTLSVMSFPGASGAALAGLPLAAGYFVFCAAAALVIAVGSEVRGRRSLSQASAVIGSVQAVALALGFLFLSLYSGVLESLETLLFGSYLGITRGQVVLLAVVAGATIAIIAAVARPLFFASIDERAARARGVPVRLLSVLLLVVLGLAVAATAQIIGVLLVFALLVAPAATAQQLTTRVARSLSLAVAIALITTWSAMALSYFTNDALSFFVTAIALVLYALARTSATLHRERAGRHRPRVVGERHGASA